MSEVKVAMIPLTRGLFATVDAADATALSSHKWHAHVSANGVVYARRNSPRRDGKQSVILMHRVIAGDPKGLVVDHRDGDGLNNRRNNLRACEHRRNVLNRTAGPGGSNPYVGVQLIKRTGKWRAKIATHGKNRHLGVFATAEQARDAYVSAAKERDPEFFPGNISEHITPRRLASAAALPKKHWRAR